MWTLGLEGLKERRRFWIYILVYYAEYQYLSLFLTLSKG